MTVSDPPRPKLCPRGLWISLSIEDELPAITPGGSGTYERVRVRDSDGQRELQIFLPCGLTLPQERSK